MVCHDIGSMRKEFDVKNSKVQEKADGRNVVKTFVERYLMKTGKEEDYVERSSLYNIYKKSNPQEQLKKTALGKRKWFEQLQLLLGSDGFYERRRLGDGKRTRELWFGWTVNTV